MRLLVVVFTILVLVGAAGVAQEKGKDKDKGKKPAEVEAGKDDSMSSEEEVKEVGGKDIDYWLEEIKTKKPGGGRGGKGRRLVAGGGGQGSRRQGHRLLARGDQIERPEPAGNRDEGGNGVRAPERPTGGASAHHGAE